jgi:hypothetical protein
VRARTPLGGFRRWQKDHLWRAQPFGVMNKQTKNTHSAPSAISCMAHSVTSQGPEYRTKYDFDSLMHYDQCAFSIDCPAGSSCGCVNLSIVVKPPNQSWQTLIGQNSHLSFWDGRIMSFLYPRADWRFVTLPGNPQGPGTFLNPYNDLRYAIQLVPEGGTIWIKWAGTYSGITNLTKPMTLGAGYGAVTITR